MSGACGDDSAQGTSGGGAVPDGCEPTYRGIDIRFVKLEPSEISLDGGEADLYFEGTLPDDVVVESAVSATAHESPIRLSFPRVVGPGPISLYMYGPATDQGGEGREVIIPCAGKFYDIAPRADLAPFGIENIGEPLHPELSRECARSAGRTVTNVGGGLLQAPSPLEPSTGFSVVGELDTSVPPCQLPLALARDQSCGFEVCFNSSVPGSYTATLGSQFDPPLTGRSVTSTVLAPTPDLDATFGVTGAIVWEKDPVDVYWTADAGPGDSALVASRGGFTILGADGGVRDVSFAEVSNGDVLGFASTPGGDIVALVQRESVFLLHFAADGAQLTTSPLARLTGGASVAVTSTGRVLVAGTDAMGGLVCAYDADGTVDDGYGVDGCAVLPASTRIVGHPPLSPRRRGAVLDGSDRIFVASDERVLRLDADGTWDATFTNDVAAVALAVDPTDDTLVAATAAPALVRIGPSGAMSPVTPAPVDPIAALAVDRDGGILAIAPRAATPRAARRWLGAEVTPVGFAADGDDARAVVCFAGGGCVLAGQTRAELYLQRVTF